jgi:mannosyltransferase OCH1-like enzyme
LSIPEYRCKLIPQDRYLILLLEGGVYTDSDTQPRSHPYLWASSADLNDLTPPILSDLSVTIRGAINDTAGRLEHSAHQITDSWADKYSNGIVRDDVSMVVGIECDKSMGPNPCIRSMQFVQWTIMVSTTCSFGLAIQLHRVL